MTGGALFALTAWLTLIYLGRSHVGVSRQPALGLPIEACRNGSKWGIVFHADDHCFSVYWSGPMLVANFSSCCIW